MDDPADLTELLLAWRGGDRAAIDRLMPRVYAELRALAHSYLRRERPDHTLDATAVLHETYLRLIERTHPNWEGRVHFFAVAAQVMRRILVDYARARRAGKRGAGVGHLAFDDEMLKARDVTNDLDPLDLLDLDRALKRLATLDERKSRAIEFRYFGGLTEHEAAEALGVSPATVRLDLRIARAWLLDELSGAGP